MIINENIREMFGWQANKKAVDTENIKPLLYCKDEGFLNFYKVFFDNKFSNS